MVLLQRKELFRIFSWRSTPEDFSLIPNLGKSAISGSCFTSEMYSQDQNKAESVLLWKIMNCIKKKVESYLSKVKYLLKLHCFSLGDIIRNLKWVKIIYDADSSPWNDSSKTAHSCGMIRTAIQLHGIVIIGFQKTKFVNCEPATISYSLGKSARTRKKRRVF